GSGTRRTATTSGSSTGRRSCASLSNRAGNCRSSTTSATTGRSAAGSTATSTSSSATTASATTAGTNSHAPDIALAHRSVPCGLHFAAIDECDSAVDDDKGIRYTAD